MPGVPNVFCEVTLSMFPEDGDHSYPYNVGSGTVSQFLKEITGLTDATPVGFPMNEQALVLSLLYHIDETKVVVV